MTTPYTYVIGWPTHNLFYYGVRYRANCHPRDFFVDYFTSSKLVYECMLKYGMPPYRKIRKTFDTPKQAIIWERRVLSRMKVLYNDKWLNKNIGGAVEFDERVRSLMSDAKRGCLWVNKDGRKTLIRKELLGVYLQNGFQRGHGQRLTGANNPMFGRIHSDETKHKIGLANSKSTITDIGRIVKSKFMKKNNPMHNANIRNKHKIKMQLLKNASKKVYYCNKTYDSLREACKYHPQIKYSTLAYKCKNKKDGWSYDQPSSITGA